MLFCLSFLTWLICRKSFSSPLSLTHLPVDRTTGWWLEPDMCDSLCHSACLLVYHILTPGKSDGRWITSWSLIWDLCWNVMRWWKCFLFISRNSIWVHVNVSRLILYVRSYLEQDIALVLFHTKEITIYDMHCIALRSDNNQIIIHYLPIK